MNREPCPALPSGWTRQSVRRTTGTCVGKNDVYYYSPQGKKIRSKPELIKEIGDKCDLSNFDYSTGKMGSSLMKPGKNKKQVKKVTSDPCQSANLNNLIPPIRQTASIFKQPVTVFKAHETEVKKNAKTEKEKPRQLFWERRLNNISPNHTVEEKLLMNLPKNIKELECLGGRSSTNTLLASISTALHLDKSPVVGQTCSPAALGEDPFVNLNPEQPLVASVNISDEDIKQQELRVNQARVKLAQAVKALS